MNIFTGALAFLTVCLSFVLYLILFFLQRNAGSSGVQGCPEMGSDTNEG